MRSSTNDYSFLILIILVIIAVIVGIIVKKIQKYINEKSEINARDLYNSKKRDLLYEIEMEETKRKSILLKRENEINIKEQDLKEAQYTFKSLLAEKTIGFPYVAEMYSKYMAAKLDAIETHLRMKEHPAIKSAQLVAIAKKQLKESEKENFQLKGIIKYYENLVPDLEEMADMPQNECILIDEDNDKDIACKFLSSDEWKKLPQTEKFQLALDRYWSNKKTKWEIGRLYERFIGYEYEASGWEVSYFGAIKGLEDMGRDLIIQKGAAVYIIQCKHWASNKIIHEKHIFQLFGTCTLYECENRKRPKGKFITSCQLSKTAKKCAEILGIDVIENKKLERYPSIKCNIGRQRTLIYHLPFDQQYDKIKIKKANGDFYCSTVKEAENAGFRRAFRWHGDKSQ